MILFNLAKPAPRPALNEHWASQKCLGLEIQMHYLKSSSHDYIFLSTAFQVPLVLKNFKIQIKISDKGYEIKINEPDYWICVRNLQIILRALKF